MRTKISLIALLLATIALTPVIASAPAATPVGADANAPTSITFDIKCRVEKVGGESTVILVDLATQTPHTIRLDDTVKIRARSKKDFNGRKKLGFADLREGQTVKVTAYVADGSVRKITVIKAA